MDWDEQRISRRMKLHDLHVLLTVARCGSMGKAATQLSVSQPAISKTIADMEHALGVRLLDRNPRGVEPTIYARALLDHGLAVVDRLSRRYPRLVFHLAAGEAGTAYRNLEERRVDLLVAPMFTPIVEEHMHAEMLYDEPLVVVVGARSSWARRRKVELAELIDAAWTLPPLDSLYGSVVAEAFRAAALAVPRATVYSSVTPVRNALLASGRFVSMVQSSTVRFGSKNAALKVLPISLPTTRRPIGIITLKNRTLSPVAQLFINCAHEIAKALTRPGSI